uniref:Uncharacterized protein n=1 Tax=Callorhinchus milii TaxID=7868 RepID=A0A4W3HG39_CALMI
MAFRVTAILLCLASLSGADSSLSAPEDLHFVSVNTENILHWRPPSDSPTPALYDVQYTRYGVGIWIEVPHCTHISNWSCDLTLETWEFNDTFITRVRRVVENVTSEWQVADYFTPIESTSLSCPTFEVKADLKQIVVSINPLVLQRGSLFRAMTDIFGSALVNKIRLRKNGSDQHVWEFKALGSWRSMELKPGEVYCVSVQTSISTRPNHSNFSSEKCQHIPQLPQGLEIGNVAIGAASAVVFTIVVLCVFFGIFYHHRSKKPEIPSVLKSFVKSNSKCRSLMDYPMLMDEVVLQVFFDTNSKLLCSPPEQGDAWRDVNIAQASSVDSGIDLSGQSGSQTSGQSGGRMSRQFAGQTSAQSAGQASGQCEAWSSGQLSIVCDEEPNHYMQQRPEPVSLQGPAAGENAVILRSGGILHQNTPDSGLSPDVSGYQKQSSNPASSTQHGGMSLASPPQQDTALGFSTPGHLDTVDCFSNGLLTLDDLVMTEATL